MNITEIKIRRLYSENKMKALVSITIDNDFAVHDIKIIEGTDRLFVAMPSRREENGTFRDVVHPITAEARELMESMVLNEYYATLEKQKEISSNS